MLTTTYRSPRAQRLLRGLKGSEDAKRLQVGATQKALFRYGDFPVINHLKPQGNFV